MIPSSPNISLWLALSVCNKPASYKWAVVNRIALFSRESPLRLDHLPFLICFTSLHAHSTDPIPNLFDVTLQTTNLSTFVYGREYVSWQMWDLPSNALGVENRPWQTACDSVIFCQCLNSHQKISIMWIKSYPDTWSLGQGGECNHSTTLSIITTCSPVSSLAMFTRTSEKTETTHPVTGYSILMLKSRLPLSPWIWNCLSKWYWLLLLKTIDAKYDDPIKNIRKEEKTLPTYLNLSSHRKFSSLDYPNTVLNSSQTPSHNAPFFDPNSLHHLK